MQNDSAERITLTVHLAAPGTPLVALENSERKQVGASDVGHMFLSIDRVGSGEPPQSFGYTRMPIPGNSDLGKVVDYDLRRYENPRYQRTIEITQEQYDKIVEFAKDPAKHGFDVKNYNLASNSCVDFAWGALNHAGIHGNTIFGEFKTYEGTLKVLDNIGPLQSIRPQVKGSELDREEWKPMPEQTNAIQRWSTDANDPARAGALAWTGTPADPSHADNPRLNQIHERVVAMNAFGADSANVSASLLALSKEQQFARVDAVLLGERRGDAAPNLFIVQGDRADPAHLRASLPADVAAQTPVAASFERVEQLAQAQPQRDAQRLQEDQQLQQSQGPRMA
ncbi:XVIPCD domain-containing protein [Stenotrophomonas sp. YAU14A_MKIMI4_1]|uniref:XVIPCD domain-containing protein n=1 Tax=Stenotrophomonas sp. YAU14A_MKIMI4_1 TaxID=2072408 RepID=UPI000D53FCF4|nr:XVIPCD domain-containing protein [Stenotrophomonas sp. YAU14A_MKIMI4_1]AWH27853.1 hypothetical protein C1931_02270 [Stenotrophomonas sp. YAU14A_MKIMI4_1]